MPPCHPLFASLAFLVVARPASAAVDLETIAQVRQDLFGQWMVPAWQLVRLRSQAGSLLFDGYAALDGSAGLGQPVDPDIYLLTASRSTDTSNWTLGRMEVLGALRGQTMDGASLTRAISPSLDLDAWGGLARHQDLDDILDQAGIGRVGVVWHPGDLRGRAGAQVEIGPGTPLVARQDAEFIYSRLDSRWRPRLVGRAVVAEPLGTSGAASRLEWGKVEAGFAPISVLDASAVYQWRDAADPSSLFGEALLESIAGGPEQEVGGRIALIGPRWAVLAGRAAWVSYTQADGSASGISVDLSYTPSRGDGRSSLVPAYAYRSGPGGAYHAIYAKESFTLSDSTRIQLREGLVPFQKGESPWDLAASAGADLERDFSQFVSARTQAEVASSAVALIEYRVGAALTVELP